MKGFLEKEHSVAWIMRHSVTLLNSPYAQRIIAWRTDRTNQIAVVLEFRILYISLSYTKLNQSHTNYIIGPFVILIKWEILYLSRKNRVFQEV